MATRVGRLLGAATTEDTRGTSLLARARRVDAVGIGLVPVVLVLVFSLPESVRGGLVLVYTDPTPVTMYSAHFVHRAPGHLLSNLLLYAMLAPTGYLLALATGHQRLFRWAFTAVLVAFPTVLSALSVLLGARAVGFGFSGVNMALFGLFTLLLGNHLSRGTRFGGGPYGGALFAGLGAGIAVSALPPSSPTLTLAGGAACLGGAYLVAEWRARRRYLDGPAHPATRPLAVVGVLVFGVVSMVVFHGRVAGTGGALTLYVHVLGFALAYTAGYAAVVTRFCAPSRRVGSGTG